jgi:O-succinylbenzoic acid--CoA ligase
MVDGGTAVARASRLAGVHVEPWLPRAAALRPELTAVRSASEELNYAQLLDAARRAAAGLVSRGVLPGDHVGLVARPGVGFAVSLHACLLAGAVAVPLDPRLTADERSLRQAGARLVIDDPPAGDASALPPRPWSADDPALVVHTSGTTGAPRPVVISHGNLLANALGSAVALGLDPAERWLCPLPLAHVGGLMVLLRSVVYATTAVLVPPPFDADVVAQGLARDATLASLVPTMLRRVLDAGLREPVALRAILLGGAPADRPLLRRARDAGVPVAQTYGLTETCSQVTVSEPGDLDSAGRALPGVAVDIADDGEIVVTGATVAGGRPLRTGDLGWFDPRGRVVVSGRRDDVIISGGENVAPAEVEAVLLEHPAVADAAVVGRRDPEWGRAVVAHVVPIAGMRPDAAELRAFCARRLAGFKVPKEVELADGLPRTASGKLLRDQLSAEGPPGSPRG